MRRTVVSVALIATLGGGCAEHEEASRSEQFDFPAEGSVRIVVRSDDGPIEVRAVSAPDVRVRVDRRARAATGRAAADLLEEMAVAARQEGHTVEVAVRSRGSRRERLGRAWAEIEIRAPERADLDLETRDGNIEIEGFESDVRAASGDGRIALSDLKGSIRVRTEDGSVLGDRLSGELEASSNDGRIQLEGVFSRLRALSSDGSIRIRCNQAVPLRGDWLIRSADGGIDLTLPRDLSADISVSTGDGRIVSDLALSQSRKSSTSLRGRLGEGGKTILIRTSDGEIRLREN